MIKLLICCNLLVLTAAGQHMISADDQRDDLQTLRNNLEKYHPGLYRYTSRDSIDLLFKEIDARITPQPVSCFYGEITMLLSRIRCGHTRSSPPSSVFKEFKGHSWFFPATVKYINKRLFIDQNFDINNTLKRGYEILSINNKSMEEINNLIFPHLSADGFITSSKYRMTENNFGFYYYLYVEQGAESYELQLNDENGDLLCIAVKGLNWENIEHSQNNKLPLTLQLEPAYALLNIRTFDSGTISAADQDYYSFLEKTFATLKEKKVKNLILDLRGNGGGDDNYGATLVSYLAKNKFNYFESIEVTAEYSDYGNVTVRNGKRLMTKHKGLDAWDPHPNRFTGNVYILIDGLSFSTCADVATVLHHHQWATFIGEETGGGYDGNTSGHSKRLMLSNSEIRVNLPMWKYSTANAGHGYYGRGVIPDYTPIQTQKEFTDSIDATLEKAIELIRN